MGTMTMDDFEDDAAKYSALERELAQPDPETDHLTGGSPEPLPLNQAEVDQGYAEQNQRHAETVRQAEHQPRYQQHDDRQLPSVEEDPIGYFQARLDRMEGRPPAAAQPRQIDVQEDPIGFFSAHVGALHQQAGEQRFWNGVEQSEKMARENISDYDDACQHLEQGRMAELERAYPDNATVHRAAQQMGLQNAAALRETLLNRDRIAVAQLAMQQGRSPAELYYEVAQQRGYASKRSMNKRESAALQHLYATDPDKFDAAWDHLARRGRL